MVQIERRVTINRPVDEVFDYMSDAENDRYWRTNVKFIKRTSGGDRSGVGSEYRQQLKGPFGGFRSDMRYTEYEKNKRVAFETVKGSVRPRASIDFSAPTPETTEVHFRLQWEPKGPWKLVAPKMKKLLESNMNVSYDALVKKLEAHEEETAKSATDSPASQA